MHLQILNRKRPLAILSSHWGGAGLSQALWATFQRGPLTSVPAQNLLLTEDGQTSVGGAKRQRPPPPTPELSLPTGP